MRARSLPRSRALLVTVAALFAFACGTSGSATPRPDAVAPLGDDFLADAAQNPDGVDAAMGADSPSNPALSEGAASDASMEASPLAACTGPLPEAGALCTASQDPECSFGGFDCRCQCECASCQGAGNCPCTGPCNWSCAFKGYETLLGNPSASVAINCTGAPSLVVTASVNYAAQVGGPALSIDNLGVSFELDKPGQSSFLCQTTTPMTPTPAGPIAPGTSLPITYTSAPITGCDRGPGNPPSPLSGVCMYCGGTALVDLGLVVHGGGYSGAGTDWPLGAMPKGTPFPITCN